MKLLLLLLLTQHFFLGPIRTDLNTATKAKLVTLEGITPALADAIIAGRPYKSVDGVRDLVGKEVFEKIADRIAAEVPKTKGTEVPSFR